MIGIAISLGFRGKGSLQRLAEWRHFGGGYAIGYRSPIDFEKEKEMEMEMEKGGENIESFKYCFLTSCILTGVHPKGLWGV